MKKLVFLSAVLLLAGTLSAQEVVKDSTNVNGTANRSKANSLDEQFNAMAQILDSKSFVIEANSLSNKWGNQRIVSNTLNFVMVDTTQSTIQVGSDSGLGPNGVGGVTVKGSISNWELTKDEKHKTFSLQMSVMTPLSIYDVFMDISAFGNASATISGMTSNKLTFRGQVVPLEESRAYVGNHL